MSKGLEALEKLTNYKCACMSEKIECKEIIEKELNEYEGAKNHIEALHKERVENSLKLKALEIIETKNIAITMIKQTNSVFEYNLFANEFYQIKRVDEDKYKLSPQPLTLEEYYLLKEVLL